MKNRMINKVLRFSRPTKRSISVVTDIVLLLMAAWAAFALRFESLSWIPTGDQLWAASATVLFTVAAFVKLGLYRAVIRYLSEYAFLAILVGVVISSISLMREEGRKKKNGRELNR